MPESRAQAARRMRVRRAAERRARAVAELRVVAAVASYASVRLAGAADPAESQQGCLVVACELERLAAALRKTAAMTAGQRRAAGTRLIADGLSTRAAGQLLGVSHAVIVRDQQPGRR